MARLSDITGIQPIYFLPEDNLADDVLIPCLTAAGTFDCMVGYFSSRSFAQLAPGLATFLEHPERKLRLIVSPFLTREDREAIENGLKSESQFVEDSVGSLLTSREGIVQHTLRCLSYLIAQKRLEMKVALMQNAQFHLKAWIVTQHDERLAAHGSGNLTEAGLVKNYEQITVSRSWVDSTQEHIVTALQRKFTTLWGRNEPSCRIYDLPAAVEDRILRDYPVNHPPTEQDYRDLVNEKGGFGLEEAWGFVTPDTGDYNNFAIPDYLIYRGGDYAHQGRAVDAWCANDFRGILEMATGSGKTITAMIGAKYAHERHGSLLIVIAAPYLPLVDQWCAEVQAFGITPVNLADVTGARKRRALIAKSQRRLRHGHSEVEVLVTTHDTLCDSDFLHVTSQAGGTKLLIADEVHNLGGRKTFVTSPPDCFDHRIGLSATPVRQYDERGTSFLTDYFGGVVFSFSLQEAIGVCLVPYDYYVHTVHLSEDESDQWFELTAKIRRMATWKDDDDRSEYVKKLLRDRRLILEIAENKMVTLDRLLESAGPSSLQHALIYATDKRPDQLHAVNALLRRKGILFHQLTAEETRNKATMRRILRSFQSGALRLLTAKRVLDEGVNIPEITTAYLLASTTVERQWIQRRGRILRKCATINKSYATLHDFLVLPPKASAPLDPDVRTMVTQELSRIMEFASIARNAGKQDGASATIHRVVKQFFGTQLKAV